MAGRASLILLKKGLNAILEKGEMQLRAARLKGHGAALSWLLWEILHFLHALDDIYSFPIVFPDFTVLQNSLTSRATDMMVFGILGGLNPSFLW